MTAFVHPTAVVDDGAVLGDGARVWHFVHVSAGALVGVDAVLGQNVYVGEGVRVGDRARVQNNVSLFAGVEIGEDVFLGPSCVFTNVRNPRAAVSRKGAFERTRVLRGATVGANATIRCGITLGEHAFVGAGAVVLRDVAAHEVVVGNPARVIGYACSCGERLSSGAPGGDLLCVPCATTYRLVPQGGCRPCP